MPEDFTIEDMDEEVVDRLRERAERNHRSLDEEVKAILQEAAREPARLPVDESVDGGSR